METPTADNADTELPTTSLAIHGSGLCPVCDHEFSTPRHLVEGVDCSVPYSDVEVLDHLTAHHTPAELALAYVLADARAAMAHNAITATADNSEEHDPRLCSLVHTSDRYDQHLRDLADKARAELLG